VKLGANEPKKLIALGALVLVGGYLAYTNVFAGSSGSSPAQRRAGLPDVSDPPVGAAGTPAREPVRPVAGRGIAGRGQTGEWHPVLHSKRPEDRPDTSKIDPILHLDILAKLQNVAFSGGGRNPFKFGPPPGKPAEPLKGPEPKIPLPPPVAEVKVTPPPAAPPPPPPIALKYYGFSSPPGVGGKTAFFLDGEDILVAKEGETVKRRYRVVRIGVNSVVMEDTDSKRQQTIPLTEEAG
jgi:hypothetical protein